MILKPEKDTWGESGYEAAYVNAAIAAQSADGWFSSCSSKYLVGYGAGAAPVELWSAAHPTSVAAQVFLDSKLEGDLLSAAGETLFGTDMPSLEPVAANNIPVPTWLIGSCSQTSADYWKQANDCGTTYEDDAALGQIYWQDKENSDALATSYCDVISMVAINTKAVDYEDEALSTSMTDFLRQYTRGDTAVFCDALGQRLIHEDAIADGRLTVNSFTWTDPTSGADWNREYMVYVPQNSSELYPDGAPVIYVFPGMGSTDNTFFDTSHWWELADEYGFLVVMLHPAGTMPAAWSESLNAWNTLPVNGENHPDDIAFVSTVMEQVEANFPVDTGRCYLSGQSLGALFAQRVALAIPERFAALGATSGPVLMGEDNTPMPENPATGIFPVYLLWGERDNWPWRVGPLQEGDFLGNNAIYGRSGMSLITQEYWVSRNGLGDVMNFEITNKDELTEPGNSTLYLLNPEQAGGDRYTTYTWTNADGIPLFQWTNCAGRPHAAPIDNMRMIWEDWLSKWTIDDDGVRRYNGASASPFSDLSVERWSYSEVMQARQAGVIQGVADAELAPEDTLSWAEAITLAARIHSLCTDGAALILQGTADAWYSGYLEYCTDNGLVGMDDLGSMDAPITRTDYAVLLAACFPEDYDAAHSDVERFSDVFPSEHHAADIELLHQAGVLEGYGDSDQFCGTKNLTREEAAVTAARMLSVLE